MSDLRVQVVADAFDEPDGEARFQWVLARR